MASLHIHWYDYSSSQFSRPAVFRLIRSLTALCRHCEVQKERLEAECDALSQLLLLPWPQAPAAALHNYHDGKDWDNSYHVSVSEFQPRT